MNKKIVAGIVIFFMVCIGAIAYVQVDRYQTEKAAKNKIEEQTKKQIEAIDKTLNEKPKPIGRGTL